MILKRMIIENFRQFHGRQELDFATDPIRNVTLIHGFNGAGKTALLNAFVWCLYKETTDDFEEADHLENEQAFLETANGGSLNVRVVLTFEDKGKNYTIERIRKVHRQGDVADRSEAQLQLLESRGGESYPVEGSNSALQDRINRILSPKLTKFFFFNGERVEWLASADAYEDVEEGVRSMLDIEIYDRSIRHLDGPVMTELTNELKKYGGNELEKAVSDKNRLEADRVVIAEEIERLRANMAATEIERERFVAELKTIEAAQALAAQQESIEKSLRDARKALADCDRDLARALSEDGYLAFGEPVLAATMLLIADARQRGELPAKIKPQFVDDLLAARKCICGRSLKEGDEVEIECLQVWRRKTGLAAHEEAISLTSAQIEPLRRRRLNYFDSLDRAQAERLTQLQIERRLSDELSAISARLRQGEGGGDAAALQACIQGADQSIGGYKTEIRLAEQKLELNLQERDAAERLIDSLKLVDKKGDVVNRQRQAVRNVVEALQKIYDIQRESVRSDLDARVQGLWNDAAVKDYTASLSDDFRLRLLKRVGGVKRPVNGASTGEKQVLALSFVGSLVAKAKDNEDEAGPDPRPGTPTGGVYPLVMDSPFGSLEDDYREKVAGWIPTLARQVIILVSKTQWRNEVEEQVRPRVGREYVLELHSSKEGVGRMIDIAGADYPYVVESDEGVERTAIVEVV